MWHFLLLVFYQFQHISSIQIIRPQRGHLWCPRYSPTHWARTHPADNTWLTCPSVLQPFTPFYVLISLLPLSSSTECILPLLPSVLLPLPTSHTPLVLPRLHPDIIFIRIDVQILHLFFLLRFLPVFRKLQLMQLIHYCLLAYAGFETGFLTTPPIRNLYSFLQHLSCSIWSISSNTWSSEDCADIHQGRSNHAVILKSLDAAIQSGIPA